MITEQSLKEAIAECEGVRNPNANTCLKLAAFYSIKDHLYPARGVDMAIDELPSYSRAAEPIISYESDSDFMQIVKVANPDVVMKVLDELMDALKVLYPKLYDSTMLRLKK